MSKIEKLLRYFEGLDELQYTREKKHVPLNMVEIRLGLIALILIFVAFDSGSPVVFVALFAVSVGLIISLLWRKYGRGSIKSQKPDGAKRANYQMSAEIRDAEPDNTYVKTESFTNYSGNIVDSWDIKDAKPPWEL